MAEQLLDAVRASGLVRRGDPLVVLVSGGADSVCLLDVAVRLCGGEGLLALHVNYGLRGADADADERHVLELCERLGVPAAVHRPGPPPGAGNLQAWARDARYGEAERLARLRGARVAAGHTASDQAETVLYRLASSPGRRALLGMSPQEGLLVRPLLALEREEVRDYCRSRGLGWREDASNADGRYARGRVRNELLEALRRVHPAAERNVVRSAQLLRDEAAVLDGIVEEVLQGEERIELRRLEALPGALARLVVQRLAEDAAGAPVAGVGARVNELVGLAGRGGSAAIDVGGGVRATVEYGVLRMEAGAWPVAPEAVELALPGSAAFGEWRLESELLRVVPAAPRAAAAEALLDAGAVGDEPVRVRGWRHGDRMAPLGLGGTKSVADLFTERRVPRARRAGTPLVEAAGEIAWIPGVATAERFRVGSHSAGVVRLRAVRSSRLPAK